MENQGQTFNLIAKREQEQNAYYAQQQNLALQQQKLAAQIKYKSPITD